jgi:hypothetical protein
MTHAEHQCASGSVSVHVDFVHVRTHHTVYLDRYVVSRNILRSQGGPL